MQYLVTVYISSSLSCLFSQKVTYKVQVMGIKSCSSHGVQQELHSLNPANSFGKCIDF